MPARPARAGRLAAAAIGLVLLLLPGLALGADDRPERPRFFGPCDGDCAITFYAGPFIEDSMADILLKSPQPPLAWDYRGDDGIVAVAASRRLATILGQIDLEPELGFGQRLGRQSEREIWAALFARYRGFPWDEHVVTTMALSTGFNYATGISAVERERADPAPGARLLHFFSPEVTFAHPSRPDVELIFRFHHRSGVFGLVSETRGGAHYGTVGLRFRF
jgi:hypothetical protein